MARQRNAYCVSLLVRRGRYQPKGYTLSADGFAHRGIERLHCYGLAVARRRRQVNAKASSRRTQLDAAKEEGKKMW
jgi:hypothetical protein